MKRKIITLLTLTAFMVASAQAQISFGLRAGVNFQNINGKNAEGNKLKNGLKIGFNAGPIVDISIADEFLVQTGLLFSVKGAVDKEVTPEHTMNISYIELPVNLLYKPLLGNGHLLLGFGPYIAYGIMGKYGENKIEFAKEAGTGDNNVFKPLDAGANLLAGYEFTFKLSVQLNAQLGLLKINPENLDNAEDQTSEKNTGFGISLGYRF